MCGELALLARCLPLSWKFSSKYSSIAFSGYRRRPLGSSRLGRSPLSPQVRTARTVTPNLLATCCAVSQTVPPSFRSVLVVTLMHKCLHGTKEYVKA